MKSAFSLAENQVLFLNHYFFLNFVKMVSLLVLENIQLYVGFIFILNINWRWIGMGALGPPSTIPTFGRCWRT